MTQLLLTNYQMLPDEETGDCLFSNSHFREREKQVISTKWQMKFMFLTASVILVAFIGYECWRVELFHKDYDMEEEPFWNVARRMRKKLLKGNEMNMKKRAFNSNNVPNVTSSRMKGKYQSTKSHASQFSMTNHSYQPSFLSVDTTISTLLPSASKLTEVNRSSPLSFEPSKISTSLPSISGMSTSNPSNQSLPVPKSQPTTMISSSPSASQTLTQTTTHQTLDEVTFYAMGDVPYKTKEFKTLSKQLLELSSSNNNNNNAEFIMHVGDIMRFNQSKCNETYYFKAQQALLDSPLPVFVTPGDNEWNECPDPDEAWEYWVKYFHNFEDNWEHELNVKRQHVREENFVFFLDGVLFLGLNLVGNPVRDENEWMIRLSQNYIWTKTNLEVHSNDLDAVVIFGHSMERKNLKGFFDPLFDLIETQYETVPFMYLHGDGHYYSWSKQMENFIDVQVDRGGRAPPLKVTVHKDALDVNSTFSIDRRGGMYPKFVAKLNKNN